MKFKSGVIAAASGSVGGYTFSHNRGGMYIRQRSTPVDPGSPFQNAVRDSMSSLSQSWQEVLTDGQRDGWATYAANVPLTDQFGDSRHVTALNMYIRSNSIRLTQGFSASPNAPVIFDLGPATPPGLVAVVTPTTATVSFNESDDWVGEDGAHMAVYVSRPKAPTINFFKNPYRYSGSIDGDSTTPPTTPATITLPFTYDIDEAQRMFAQFRVTRVDGRLTTPFRSTVLSA
jgi:hypothetical protein